MPQAPPTLEAINRAIASRYLTLRFEDDIERHYREDMPGRRKCALVVVSIIGIMFFDVFLIDDWRVDPSGFGLALLLRMGILTPAGLYCILRTTVWRPWSFRTAETSVCICTILAAVLTMILYDRGGPTSCVAYHYGCALIMILVAMVQRIPVRLCIASVTTILAVQIAGLIAGPPLTPMIFQGDCVFFTAVAVLVIVAAYGLEHEYRRSYLLSIRGELLIGQLADMANVDPLTGLWNRRHLNAVMTAAWARTESAPREMAVVILDIDHFKLFNDTYGHLGGDECLRRFGACIRRGLAPYGDMAVRFGGEEFVIFMEDVDAATARHAATALQHALRSEAIPYPARGEGAIVTASIGLATGCAPFVSASTLLGQADAALYEAKRAGRDCLRPRSTEPMPYAVVA